MDSNTKSQFSKATITSMVQHHFGDDVSVKDIKELTEGWFNAIYVIKFAEPLHGLHHDCILKTGVQEDTYVLSYEEDLMKAELNVYDLLVNSQIPTARIIAQDTSRTVVDCDYFFMERLPGKNWEHLQEHISKEQEALLIEEIGAITACFHEIKGPYFGYIKDNLNFRFDTWKEAFQYMVKISIADGIKQGLDLPFNEILTVFEPLWDYLDDVKEPSLVHFDMWKKNIMLSHYDDVYQIDAILDFERAFYGDPIADFIASNTICSDVTSNLNFKRSYESISGKPLVLTYKEQIRYLMYSTYLGLLLGVEVYRYNETDGKSMLAESKKLLNQHLKEIREIIFLEV